VFTGSGIAGLRSCFYQVFSDRSRWKALLRVRAGHVACAVIDPRCGVPPGALSDCLSSRSKHSASGFETVRPFRWSAGVGLVRMGWIRRDRLSAVFQAWRGVV